MSVQQDNIRTDNRRARECDPAVVDARGEARDGCRCSVTALPSPLGNIVVLRVAGEIDLCTIALVQTALRSLLSHGFEHLIVDLADVTFCSSRGLTLLIEAASSADHTTRYALSGASPQAERIWALLWPADQLPTRYPTAHVGVLAAMAHQAAHDLARSPAGRGNPHTDEPR